MRILSDSLVTVVDQGYSSLSARAAPPPLPAGPATSGWAWTAGQAQAQVTPHGRISTINAHTGLILAVLLCAFAVVLSLHSLLYYCGGRRGGGLKESALRRMPVAVYQAEAAGGAECAICLGEFADGDAVRLLPRCHHGFHVSCIDTWLSAHTSCPICRDSLLVLDDVGDSATAAGGEMATVAGEGT